MKKLILFLRRIGLLKSPFKIQSFTFYIPAPPQRNTSYREKQFDQTFCDFINHGFKIISINTQGHVGGNHSGMWFICVVQALTEEADQLNLSEISDRSEKTEGLYHLEY
jgi:hypothetical protein